MPSPICLILLSQVPLREGGNFAVCIPSRRHLLSYENASHALSAFLLSLSITAVWRVLCTFYGARTVSA